MFDCPNLDDLTIDPQELRQVGNVLYLLSHYARAKANAMEYRLRGRMTDALEHESQCEKLYQKLPQWAKW